MHPNPAFRQTPEVRNLEFARSRGFGTLALNAEPGPLLAHVPFLLNAEGTVRAASCTLEPDFAAAGRATGRGDFDLGVGQLCFARLV